VASREFPREPVRSASLLLQQQRVRRDSILADTIEPGVLAAAARRRFRVRLRQRRNDMSDAEYPPGAAVTHDVEDAESRNDRREAGNAKQRWRYANDPEYRSHILRVCRNRYLKRRYGITIDEFDKSFAAQHGACAVCSIRLGRVVRVDQTRRGVWLLCTLCAKELGCLRNILAHPGDFEAYFELSGMSAELARYRALMAGAARGPGTDPVGEPR
jgi:hypothetical protein